MNEKDPFKIRKSPKSKGVYALLFFTIICFIGFVVLFVLYSLSA